MDIITHAVVGGTSGMMFGHPALGLAVGVMPDLVLGPVRRAYPNGWYNVTHSPLLMIPIVAVAVSPLGVNAILAAVLAYLSHIVLDVPTHGKRWAPMLFAPIRFQRVSLGGDWEWFNREWWNGFYLATIWNAACIVLLS